MRSRSPWAVVLIDTAVWAGWSTAVGYAARQLPSGALARDAGVTRIRQWEHDGRTWEAVGIRRWKDRLPDFGPVLGSSSKRHLPGWGVDGLERFAVETRRAELVHWAIPAALPLFALWNPPALFSAMALYAVAANVPCLLVQRYNRARIEQLLTRRRERARRQGSAGARQG
ncbi:hypothetical protein [Terrabacter sp. NPDC080008]|uniref:glycosyl-4,4'-diaponeurosporenoate acyltransferase CrtO family protein n=1 Tax=Terrabacter sp. NPDC080008 TaxID=3155176 RepID=UPI00344D3351